MAIREILKMGHPTLRQRAREMTLEEIRSAETRSLIADMAETLDAVGGIGLAAPQIDVPLRLAIIRIPGGPSRYGEIPQVPLTVYANPVIEVRDETLQGFWEGCLSVPGLRGFVERPRAIRVRWQDLEGEGCEAELDDFLATVFQHEFDHLDGVLYVDRLQDIRTLVFEDELARHGEPGVEQQEDQLE